MAAGGRIVDTACGAGNGLIRLAEHYPECEIVGVDVDDAPAAAFISEMAVLLAYLPMAVGLLQGLRMCDLHDLPREWFEETVLKLYPFHIRLLERATTATEGPGRNIGIAQHAATR